MDFLVPSGCALSRYSLPSYSGIGVLTTAGLGQLIRRMRERLGLSRLDLPFVTFRRWDTCPWSQPMAP